MARPLALTLLVAIGLAAASYVAWLQMQPAVLPTGFLYSSGHVEGTEVDVGAELTARVVEANSDEGAVVSPGDVLARLDDAALAARRAEVEARLRGVQAARLRLAAERKTAVHHQGTAAAERERIERLFRAGQASARQRDEARNAASEAAGRLDALAAGDAELAAQRDALRQQLRRVELLLDKSVIRAPIGGTVLVKGVEAGELAVPGRLVARLVDLGHVDLEVFVAEADLGKIRLGAPARVKVSAYPDRHFPARVAAVDAQAQFTPRDIHLPSERVRTVFGVTLALDNPDGLLKPGMPADAWIQWRPESEWPAELVVPR